MVLLAVCGKARSGKDTFADYLIKNYGFEKKAFADPLKEMCRALFMFNDEQLYGNLKEIIDERWNITPREALQKLGTEFVRENINNYLPNLDCIPKDFWLKRFQLWYEDNKDKNIIISDIRFANESELIKKLGGTIIRVKSINDVNNTHSHISENMFDEIPVDLEIYNNYTKEYFFSINCIMSQFEHLM